MAKLIMFTHYPAGVKDDIVHHILKRKQFCEERGARTIILNGEDEYMTTEPTRILFQNTFVKPVMGASEAEIFYIEQKSRVKDFLADIFRPQRPDLMFVHNDFSLGYNLAFSFALLEILDQLQIKTVAVHHDFWYEHDLFRKSYYRFMEANLKSLPPKRSYIQHQVVDKSAQKSLLKRAKIKATVYDENDYDFCE